MFIVGFVFCCGVLRQYTLCVKSVCTIYTPPNMKLHGYLAPKQYTHLSYSLDLYLICMQLGEGNLLHLVLKLAASLEK